MAQVDFSNAVLDVYGTQKPMEVGAYMSFYRTGTLYNLAGTAVSSGSQSKITDTPSKVSILFSGSFTASGTEFYIVYYADKPYWKVSNISFSSGDTYSFIIDIETSGN